MKAKSLVAANATINEFYLVDGRRLLCFGICAGEPQPGAIVFGKGNFTAFIDPESHIEELCCLTTKNVGINPVGLRMHGTHAQEGRCPNCGQKWRVELPREKEIFHKVVEPH